MMPVTRDDVFMKLNFRCGPWVFSPGLVSSFFTLLLVPLFVYLGCWQFDRGREKTQQQETLEHRMKEPIAKGISALMASLPKPTLLQSSIIETLRYKRLEATGIFLNDKQILLDNQIFEGRIGYRILTPLLLQDSKILLVDRGWIPMGKNRNELPIVPAIPGKISVVGMVNQYSHGLQLKHFAPVVSWPFVTQQIDFKMLSDFLGQEVYPFILQVSSSDPLGFQVPPPSFGIPAKRHLGYAMQWLVMAFAVFVYYVVINSRQANNER